jgi:hypothetical protein
MFASSDGHHERDVWLRLGRWLVAGLTFQLAADVLETAITTSWDEVARLAAIAAIRTFLNYFLERDLGEIRATQRSVESANDGSGSKRPDFSARSRRFRISSGVLTQTTAGP